MHLPPKRTPRLIPNRGVAINELDGDILFKMMPNAKNGTPKG